MNTENTPPEKMSTAEKAIIASGCTVVALINLAWIALLILAVAALIKFVAG